MSGAYSIRFAATAALGALAILWGSAGAAPPPDAAEILEVKVLETQVPQGQGAPGEVVYRMEVLSVLHSASRVEPGETVTVRANSQSQETLERGWTGTAYLNRDPKASSPDSGRQFVTAAEGLVKLPPGPPSLRFTVPAPEGGQ